MSISYRDRSEAPPYSGKVRAFLYSIVAIGATCMWIDLIPFQTSDTTRFLTYFVMAALAAGLRVSLPTVSGTLSINFLFILIGLVHLTRAELVVLAGGAAVIQCLFASDRSPNLLKVMFNLSVAAISVHLSTLAYWAMPSGDTVTDETFKLMPAALVLFLCSTIPVSIAIAWTEGRRIIGTWRDCSLWSLPYSVAVAAVAGCFATLSHRIGWQLSLLVLPVVYLITRSYQLHIARVDDGLRHAEELAGLHLRTIEALALAIEAKDSTTANHLERVQTYAIEIGRIMRISESELEALRAGTVDPGCGRQAAEQQLRDRRIRHGRRRSCRQ